MIARAIKLLPVVTLALATSVISTSAHARPLRPSDLPPDLRGGDWSKPLPKQAAIQQTGIATYYSSWYNGRRTATGDRYDPHGLTAAHPSLPLGTRVRVTRLDTGRSIVVTVNDRQARNGRLIDLSRHAAEMLGFVRQGTTHVRLTTLPADAAPEEVAEAP